MKQTILFNISNKLKELRLENKLTQQELASGLNMKRATYTNYEAARVEMSLDTLNKIANFFKINIDYLLSLDKRKNITYNQDVNYEILALNLTKFMKQNKLKIEAFALDANTTISTIWAYLHKEHIRVTYLYLICKNNNLSVDNLLERN